MKKLGERDDHSINRFMNSQNLSLDCKILSSISHLYIHLHIYHLQYKLIFPILFWKEKKKRKKKNKISLENEAMEQIISELEIPSSSFQEFPPELLDACKQEDLQRGKGKVVYGQPRYQTE